MGSKECLSTEALGNLAGPGGGRGGGGGGPPLGEEGGEGEGEGELELELDLRKSHHCRYCLSALDRLQ